MVFVLGDEKQGLGTYIYSNLEGTTPSMVTEVTNGELNTHNVG